MLYRCPSHTNSKNKSENILINQTAEMLNMMFSTCSNQDIPTTFEKKQFVSSLFLGFGPAPDTVVCAL